MRSRASQVARIRLVETEEDVETVHEDDGLSVSVHWRVGALALHPSPCQGEVEGAGGGSVFYLPQVKMLLFRYLHIKGGGRGGRNGSDKP